MNAIELPPGSEPLHRAIAQKATENLGRLVDGNGLKSEQIRLAREETQIHRIAAFINAKLTTEIIKRQLRGKAAQGMVVNTAAEAKAGAEGLARNMLKAPDVQNEISMALRKDPGQGFGIDQLTIPLPAHRKDFSIISTCPKCNGGALISCGRCIGSGRTPCTMCQGNGFSSCQWCRGAGRIQNPQGEYIPCVHCQNTGRISCTICRGSRTIVCTTCQGQGRTGCVDCGQTGFFTEVHQVNYKAECLFDIDWREVSPEGRSAAHKLGLRELATGKHAEILWQPVEARLEDIYIPCVAFLPVATMEFSVAEGRNYPAIVAGLQGCIIEIKPMLDEYLKPGIGALMKLSKGPMARQALIDTACKYRLIRQTLALLARSSKKNVYQRLCKNYPLILSTKYAGATVKYAAIAVTTLSARPRYQGLAVGTVLAALLSAIYYITPLRIFLLAQLQQYIFAADIIIWLAGWAIAVYTIRLITAAALKKMLPKTVEMGKNGLPSAGAQGLAALLTTAGVWFAIATRAAEKPEWVLYIFKMLGL